MRRRVVRGLVAGWVVLAGAGWAAAQWLGEPAATSGPAPVTPPSSAAEPGPQPEFDCAEAMRAAKRSPIPSPSGTPFGGEGVQHRVTAVICDYAVEGH
ncbi:hypothetical protein ABZ565_12090 [Streptomyces sp. NPDC016469]|uniref:hypothetical protein n=1 Tax=Streptomyces sp. NPDC016469 TaxID=3157191 RepID=UPI0033FF33EB